MYIYISARGERGRKRERRGDFNVRVMNIVGAKVRGGVTFAIYI